MKSKEEFEEIIKLNFFDIEDSKLEGYSKLCDEIEWDLIRRIRWKLFHVCERRGHKMIVKDEIIFCKRCGRDISRW